MQRLISRVQIVKALKSANHPIRCSLTSRMQFVQNLPKILRDHTIYILNWLESVVLRTLGSPTPGELVVRTPITLRDPIASVSPVSAARQLALVFTVSIDGKVEIQRAWRRTTCQSGFYFLWPEFPSSQCVVDLPSS